MFQSIRGEEGGNSIKNTVTESCDNRVSGISEHPRENRVVTPNNDWKMKNLVFLMSRQVRGKIMLLPAKMWRFRGGYNPVFDVSD